VSEKELRAVLLIAADSLPADRLFHSGIDENPHKGIFQMRFIPASVFISLSLVATFGATSQKAIGQQRLEAVADAQGNMHVPADYRAAYQYLGSWAVAEDSGHGSKQMHVVYASPGAAETYRENGHFADGSVLVKEVFAAQTSAMTTGTVSRVDTLMGWFVMVKDSKNSHPENKLWGSGWGWAWFDAATPLKTKSTDYTVDCQSCHVPAQATDWTYVEGYPVLKR
jgi:hypothetical protein